MEEERAKYITKYVWRLLRGLIPALLIISISTITVQGEPPTLLHGIYIRSVMAYYIISMSFGWGKVRDIESAIKRWVLKCLGKTQIKGNEEITPEQAERLAWSFFIKIVVWIIFWPLLLARIIIYMMIAAIPGMVIFPLQSVKFFKLVLKKDK